MKAILDVNLLNDGFTCSTQVLLIETVLNELICKMVSMHRVTPS